MHTLGPQEARRSAVLVHDEYRTALLNQKYFGCCLTTLEWRNRWMEIVIAMGTTGATGTGVASLTVWKTDPGVAAWVILSGLAVILSSLKPILNLPAQIEKCAKLYGEYASLVASLRAMEQDFHRNDAITSEQMQLFDQLRQRSGELEALGPPDPDRALIDRLEAEVNREVPTANLWMPPQAPLIPQQPSSPVIGSHSGTGAQAGPL